jgi:DNA polymerase III delta subunit
MVVFCGEDNYESYINATKHLKLLLKNNGYKKEVVDADDEEYALDRVIDEITNFDLFGDKKIVFLKRISKNSVLMEELFKNFGFYVYYFTRYFYMDIKKLFLY